MWENSGIYADFRDSKVSANTIISRLRVMDLSARDKTLSNSVISILKRSYSKME